MSTRDSYQPGTPSWIDIGSPEPNATAAFYTELFGWQVDEESDDPTYGGYRMASIDGKAVAGIGPAQQPGTPWWSTYITVADADATAKAVADAGGQTLVEPFDVSTFGRMAVFMDPAGAAFSIWEAKEHIGAERVNEHGSLTWNELHTTDVAGAKDFYGKIFGWHFNDVDMGEFAYTTFNVTESDQGIGGIMPDQSGGHVPPHWAVYFAVDDCDAATAKVTELGGTVLMAPETVPGIGRMSAVTGKHGEAFSLITNETSD